MPTIPDSHLVLHGQRRRQLQDINFEILTGQTGHQVAQESLTSPCAGHGGVRQQQQGGRSLTRWHQSDLDAAPADKADRLE